jgi:pre-mRNA-processing factor 17
VTQGGGGGGHGGDGDKEDAAAAAAAAAGGACSSRFHGRDAVDYQGRSWVEAPKGVRADGGDHACFPPRRLWHTYRGHTQGVQSIDFLPGTGHLLLSGGMDGKAKVWDVAGDRGVRRTYLGHAGAVRDARFDGSGARFATASFDRSARVWDTETGACVVSLPTQGRIAQCVAWCPQDPNVVVLGSSNKKLLQCDVRSGEVALEYNYHLDAVNTVTFFDGGRRMASTSDDKKLLVWDYNTPVPIKYIADPAMHAIAAATLHPTEEMLACQSMDNQIAIYHAGERVALNRKKRFTGHVTAGFACQIDFAPNGQFIASGDGEGQLHLWEWKSGRFVKKIKCHENGPCIGVQWHPLQPSVVATCGWDGLIKLWQ